MNFLTVFNYTYKERNILKYIVRKETSFIYRGFIFYIDEFICEKNNYYSILIKAEIYEFKNKTERMEIKKTWLEDYIFNFVKSFDKPVVKKYYSRDSEIPYKEEIVYRDVFFKSSELYNLDEFLKLKGVIIVEEEVQ